MRIIAGILEILTGLYIVLITVRVLITWFSREDYGAPYEALRRITDPWLNLFRRFPVPRTAGLDLSPVAALAVLSLLQRLLGLLSLYGRLTPGLVLLTLLGAVWSALSFILGFFTIVLLLHLAAAVFHLRGAFWNVISAVSRPLLYRITRLFFRNRLVDHRWGIILALVFLGALRLGGGWAVGRLAGLLSPGP